MQDKKRRITLNILVFSSILLVLVGMSYAYLARIRPTDKSGYVTDLSAATTGQLKLVYSDCLDESSNDCKNIQKNLEPGESISKTFQVTNDSAYDLKYTLYFQNLLNSFVNDELVYDLVSLDTGETIINSKPVPYREHLDVDVPIKEDIRINQNETHKYRLTVTFLNTNYDQSANDYAEYYITMSFAPSNTQKVPYVDAYARQTDPSFDLEATSDEGLYMLEDDYGMSYYYRGNVANNYVKFAGYYWRIIRINGDGTLRIIYDGTVAHENGAKSLDRLIMTDTEWHKNIGDAKYSGFMFGNTDAAKNEMSSNIKNVLDDWYKKNIIDAGYADYVADTLFCNDRSTVASGTDTYFGGYDRLHINSNPSFKCSNKEDAFTVSDSVRGNASLDYPIGLITADELMTAGLGSYNTGTTRNYLFKGYWYWSMTPHSYENNINYMFNIDSADIAKLVIESANSKGGVVPVINLTKDYATSMTGKGTIDDPYTV